MEYIKRKYGLTNYEIAKCLSELNDQNFYEVMEEFKNISEIRKQSIGEWLDDVLIEIQVNK